MTLQKKVMTAVIGLLLLTLLIIGSVSQWLVTRSVEEDAGNKAMHAASVISEDQAIIQAMTERDQPKLDELARRYEHVLQADYVVIGDERGIRYAHPLKERIGLPMIGDDNERALELGESYISRKEGSLGFAIRGKSAIHNDSGDIIGVISVGFLVDSFESVIGKQRLVLWGMIAILFVIGSIVSYLLSHHIKRLLLNLEPKEISRQLMERDAIMRSTREGIIAYDADGQYTFMNDSAKRLCEEAGVRQPETFLRKNQEKRKDEIVTHGDVSFIVNERYMEEGERVAGYVVTLRKKTDLELLTLEMQQLQAYTHLLRAQTHEFKNRLHTLLGLMQLQKWEEAERYIQTLFENSVTEQRTVESHIQDPYIQSLLLGKLEYAKEWKVDVQIDEASHLAPLPQWLVPKMITIVGNTLDNAIEAASESEEAYVTCYMKETEEEWYIEFIDSGFGFPDELDVTQEGVSEKGDHRGYGIPAVLAMLASCEGELTTERFQGETIVTITIPKGEKV